SDRCWDWRRRSPPPTRPRGRAGCRRPGSASCWGATRSPSPGPWSRAWRRSTATTSSSATPASSTSASSCWPRASRPGPWSTWRPRSPPPWTAWPGCAWRWSTSTSGSASSTPACPPPTPSAWRPSSNGCGPGPRPPPTPPSPRRWRSTPTPSSPRPPNASPRSPATASSPPPSLPRPDSGSGNVLDRRDGPAFLRNDRCSSRTPVVRRSGQRAFASDEAPGAISSGSRTRSIDWGLPRSSARKGAGQAEPGHDAVLEAGHGRDPLAGQCEDEEADAVADPVGAPEVGTEGQLAVGPGRDEVVGAAPQNDGSEEAGHDVPPDVLEGDRRHRHADVLGEQGHQPVDVARLVGLHEPLHH